MTCPRPEQEVSSREDPPSGHPPEWHPLKPPTTSYRRNTAKRPGVPWPRARDRVGAGNSVRGSDLLVFAVGRSRGHAHPKLELPSIRWFRGSPVATLTS